MFHQLKKRPLTLIELIIAAALTVAVMTTLLYFYRQLGEIGQRMDSAKEENFKLRYAESRLAEIFPRTVSKNSKNTDFVFFSFADEGTAKGGSQNLIFTFDNDISLDKSFSNHVIARLYIDPSSRLMLAYWPSPKRQSDQSALPIKQEVLLDGVEDIKFEFYIPPESKKTEAKQPEKEETAQKSGKKGDSGGEKPAEKKQDEKEAKAEPEPKGDWRRLPWLEEYESLPAMIRVIVKLKGKDETVVFAFPLSNGSAHPVYE